MFQPLRIPSGWFVKWNTLSEIDPSPSSINEFTGSSLLVLNSPVRGCAIDVSWRPEGDIQGAYKLQLIRIEAVFNAKTNEMDYVGDWESPLVTFSTKDRMALVAELERLMIETEPLKDERMLKVPGVVDQEMEALRLALQRQGPQPSIVKAILESSHKQLQLLFLNHPAIDRSSAETLALNGITKGVRNKAKQWLISRKNKK